MTDHKTAPRTFHFSNLPLRFAALLLVLLSAASVPAQTSVTDGKTPAGLAPGSPSGSYSLSGFESVNLFNGGLNFRLPLLRVGGRGGAGYAVTLPVEQKWIVKAGQSGGLGPVSLTPNPNWWQGIRPGYGPGVLHGRPGSYEDGRVEVPYGCDGSGQNCSTVLSEIDLRTLTRLTFTASDGTEYELRDRPASGAPGGEPHADVWTPQRVNPDGFNRGKVFVTADGNSATFISDADITDYVAPTMTQTQRLIYPSGELLLSDGTRYRIDSGMVTWVRDRNGNEVTFAYGAGSRVSSAADSLGRQVTFTYDDGVRHYDEISFPGFGGAARSVRVWYDSLSNRLRANSGYSAQTYYQLFALNSASTTTLYNPASKVSEIELPDHRRYKLYYNPYGELARVELPTGGAVEYDWAGVVDATDATIFRRVTKRRVYPNGGTAWVSQTEYVRAGDGANSTVEEKTTDPAGALLARAVHYFHGDAPESLAEDPARPAAISYSKWREGREYKTESFDIVSGTPVLKRVVEQTWRQPLAGAMWPLTGQGETDESARPNGPQVTEVKTTLSDTNQASKQTFAYDQYGNRTDTWEYDYGAGTPGAFVRRTHTDFVTAPAYVNADANPILGASLRSLPRETWVSTDIAGADVNKVSRTSYLYDQSALTDPGITGHDAAYGAGFMTRGNLTNTTSYLNPAAPSGGITTTATYDVAGNVTSATDARGKTSYVSYGDNFSDGNNARGTYAFPTGTTSAVPDPAGQYGSAYALTSSTVYDFYSGSAVSSTDANGKITSFDYTDPLDRIKSVTHPDGGVTTYIYDRSMNAGVMNDYVRTLTSLDSSRSVDSYQFFDGLGRPNRAFLNEGGSPAVLITSDTQYDAMGRAYRVSNPYRTNGSGQAVNPSNRWTTTAYDALGRVKSVTTPDGAAVATAYSGNQVTVTDQAGKKKSSVSDAFGRLTQVAEDPTPGGLNYVTTYTYDVLGNLRKVNQGGQVRFFMYDALSRLIRAKNPEHAVGSAVSNTTDILTGNSQWSLAYGYDNNGNLMARVDARSVTTNYAYDNLNRNTVTTYTTPSGSGVASMPDVKRYYDNAASGANGLGRLYYSEAVGSRRRFILRLRLLRRGW